MTRYVSEISDDNREISELRAGDPESEADLAARAELPARITRAFAFQQQGDKS